MSETTYERTVAVFEADTAGGERKVLALVDRLTKLEQKLASWRGTDQYTKKFESASKKVEKTYRDSEQQTERHVGRINRILSKIVSPIDRVSKALSGRLSGDGGGLLPFLSNISNVIQGLPQIGQLAHALVSPLTQAASEGIEFNSFLEQTTIAFEGVAGGADKAKAHVEKLIDFANRTPFEGRGIVEAAQFMNAFGFELDEQIPKLRIWGDAIAATGEVSAARVEQVVRGFGQIRLAGRVMGGEMLQLTNANIPAWELLAKAIGRSVAETKKLGEAGRLKGKESIEAITAMMAEDPRYKDMMKKQEASYAGRMAALNDKVLLSKAAATKPLFDELSGTVQVALDNPQLADNIAAGLQGPLEVAGKLIRVSVSTMIGGGLVEGLVAGMWEAKGFLTENLKQFALEGVVGNLSDWFGINSPAKTTIPIGESLAEGIAVGLDQGVDRFSAEMMGSVDKLVNRLDAYAAGRGKRLSRQESNERQMRELFGREPDFLPTLKRESQRRGINPDDILNLIAIESSFNKTALNKWGYLGLGQVGRAERGQLGLPTGDREAQRLFASRSATWQLEKVIFPFLDIKSRESKFPLKTLDQLYAAWGSGRAYSDPNHLHMEHGGKRANAYRNNPQWDYDKDGQVRQWEFGPAAQSALGAGKRFTVNDPGYVIVVGSAGVGGSVTSGRALQPGRDLQGGYGQFIAQTAEASDDASLLANAFARLEDIFDGTVPLASYLTEEVTVTANVTKEAADAAATLKQNAEGTAQAFDNAASKAGTFYELVVGKNEKWVEDVKGAFESSFEGMFDSFLDGWRATISSFLLSFLGALQQMVAASLAARLGDALFGVSQEGGGRSGGWISKLIGWVGGALFGGFGGGGGAGTGGTSSLNPSGGFAGGQFNYGSGGFGSIFSGNYRFAEGGVARGAGTGTSDSIWARLSNGEGVVTEEATRFYGGEQFINALNQKSYPRYARGGVNYTRPGRTRFEALREESGGAGGMGGDTHIHLHMPVLRSVAQLHPEATKRAAGIAVDSFARHTQKRGRGRD